MTPLERLSERMRTENVEHKLDRDERTDYITAILSADMEARITVRDGRFYFQMPYYEGMVREFSVDVNEAVELIRTRNAYKHAKVAITAR